MSKPSQTPQVPCAICRRSAGSDGAELGQIHGSTADFIRTRHAELEPSARICRTCLNDERTAQLLSELERDRGELSSLERDVSRKAAEHAASAEHIEELFEREATRGQRMADAVASVGGSWPFVLGFIALLVFWICLNTLLLNGRVFDPYPFILLNLVLSCLAALQAPIIMMSQNRSAARDRLEADEDFKINLKSELEIAALHEKVDHLLHVQWTRLVEIQQAQLELLEQLTHQRS